MPPPITEKETLTTLVELYKEQCDHGRHTESQRQEATNLLILLTTALLALMGVLHFSKYPSLLFSMLIILFGLLGYFFMRAFERKWDESADRRNFYRKHIENLANFDPNNPKPHPNIEPPPSPENRKTLRKFWKGVSLSIIVLGVISGIVAYFWGPLP